ncbi:hypothetical protein VNO77_36638 [Canavalia gladiata]|uniref:AP2/ERF domain-containing protein n=1 Tax=Canavalia gladiata TaxID=3824 RepID=A0AAN9PWC0_CANGL
MDFENTESPKYSTSPSSSSSISKTKLSPPNPSELCDSSNPQDTISSSHKRKAGRKKFRETRHPVYRGVRKRNGNKWVCEVREPNNKSRIWLGTYPTPEMAARAHDVAVLALRGTSAKFNFPDSALLLPIPKSRSPTHIREAAAQATTQPFKPNVTSHNNVIVVDTEEPCLEEHERVLSMNMECVERVHDDGSKTMFLDEEALYNMPGLLHSMAEGLLITPPSMTIPMDSEDIDSEIVLTLWNE